MCVELSRPGRLAWPGFFIYVDCIVFGQGCLRFIDLFWVLDRCVRDDWLTVLSLLNAEFFHLIGFIASYLPVFVSVGRTGVQTFWRLLIRPHSDA